MHINPNHAASASQAISKAPTSAPKSEARPAQENQTAALPEESVSLSAAPKAAAESPKTEAPAEAPAKDASGKASEDGSVKVAIYRQDPYVDKPLVMDIPQNEIGSNLSSERAVIRDKRPHAKPDADGNYILAEGSDGISQVNSLYFTTKTLQLFEDYRGSSIPWATRSDQLSVTPHKQEGRNAFYSRWSGGTNYFFSDSPGLDTVMKTANSADVVSHETGHALLDGVRPGFFGTHDPETGAFHEAFGDCAAMLMTLRQEGNKEDIVQTTGGDLREHNVMSSLAEEFGAARAFDNDDPSDDHKIWLRTAINSFTYQDPSTIPPGRGDDDNLGREVHSFSRLFSGAFYDAIESVYNQSVNDDGQSPKEALQTSEKVLGPVLMRAIESGSTSQVRFKDIALGMLDADKTLNDGKYSEGLKQVFMDRKFITADDLSSIEKRREGVPALDLPSDLTVANAVDFLEANSETLGLPADVPYTPDGVTKNNRGETFVSYRYSQEVPVTVEGMEGYVTDVQGGVNLMFDANGKLVDRIHDSIDANTIDREMAGIDDMRRKNAIVEKEAMDLYKTADMDTSVFKSAIEGNKIVRIPISGCKHDH